MHSPPPPYTIHLSPRPITRPLVGVFGPAGAGKDTYAAHLVEEFGFVRVALADPVREMLLALDPYVHTAERTARLSTLVAAEGWDAAKRISDVRRLLQRLGTDAVRAQDRAFWTRQATHKITHANAPVVVTDVRFPDEAGLMTQGLGGIMVRIEGAPSALGANGAHSSETAMASWVPDITVHNPPAIPEVFGPRLTQAAQATVTHVLKGLATS